MDDNTESLSGDRSDLPDSASELPDEPSKFPGEQEQSASHQTARSAIEQVMSDEVAAVHDRKSLRWMVLVANLLIPVLAFATAAFYSDDLDFFSPSSFSIFSFYVPFFASFTTIAPALFACTVVAWGPWRPIVRCVVFAVAMAAISICMLLTYSKSAFVGSITFASAVTAFFALVSVFVSATLVLVWIGSLLRLRIGPPHREPVRVSIIGLMCATAVLGALIVVKGRVDQWRHQELMIEYDEFDEYESLVTGDITDDSSEQQFQVDALWQVMMFGPILGLCIAICAASYCRWLPRIAVVLMALGVPLISNIVVDSDMVFVTFAIVILIFFGFWTAFCIYMLKLSGWPLSRRLPSKSQVT